jgi:hypothetical protein
MANLIQIDLEKNIVVPIKEPFNKEQLVNTLAEYWGYEKGEEKVVRKEYLGTLEDFENIFVGKNYSVISSDNGVVIYDLTENIPYELSKTEWVIYRYLKPSTDLIISILVDIQTTNERKEIDDLKNALKQKMQETNTVLEVLKNVKLE